MKSLVREKKRIWIDTRKNLKPSNKRNLKLWKKMIVRSRLNSNLIKRTCLNSLCKRLRLPEEKCLKLDVSNKLNAQSRQLSAVKMLSPRLEKIWKRVLKVFLELGKKNINVNLP